MPYDTHSQWLWRALVTILFLNHLKITVFASPLLRHEVEGVHSIDDPALQRRQDDGTVAITGINTFGIQPRLEIRQLEQDTDQWNIFLLGMQRFQQTDQSDQISYYQIAGIHGRPYVAWDGVPSATGVEGPGYCAHLSNLFLAWHRPYLALFEQTLYQHIVAVVNEFPAGSQRQRYASAALSWRFPYWDWAATPTDGGSTYPTSMQSQTINVNTPNGTATIHNPLFSYKFHPVSQQDFYFNPFATWNETKRFPTSWDLNATSQNNLLGPVFDNNQVSFQDRLYNLFTNYDNFTEFGNEAWMNPSVQNADSLESIHDAIHSIVGSNGHMTYLDYSAFDPSFFLHHAMIDRCFALWQALYPDSYVEPMAAIEQTFTTRVGDMMDENSALEPFFSDSKRDYWTAASVRSISTFGYTYPELVGNGNVSAIKAAINQIYGSSIGSSGISRRSIDDREEATSTVFSHAEAEKVSDEVIRGRHRQYMANIVSQKFALNGSYAIYVFIGDFNDTPSAWPTSPSLVGTHAIFGAIDMTSSTTSKVMASKPGIQVTGSMPLTSMLLTKADAGEIPDMAPATIEAYLTANLHWRVGMFDGTEVPSEDVADLTVTVVTAQVQPAASPDEFPDWGNFVQLTHITQGKPGGC